MEIGEVIPFLNIVRNIARYSNIFHLFLDIPRKTSVVKW